MSRRASRTDAIRPQALIIPATSHAEVIVAAVAARDIKKAQAYAKKYNIPIVHKTYDGKSTFYIKLRICPRFLIHHEI
jgi:hypothetical protein